jgi:hypothetical protein
MLKLLSSSLCCFAAVLVVGAASAAHAASFTTWVSSHGSDAAACNLAAPCRTLKHAFTQTANGGQIRIKDAGEYGGLTIGRSVSIINDGAGIATVTVDTGIGITVHGNGTNVVLKGLTIKGAGGTNGIFSDSNGGLQILNCLIQDMHSYGIVLQPISQGSATIVDTALVHNAGGLFAKASSSGIETLSLERVQILKSYSAQSKGMMRAGEGAAFLLASISSSLIADNNTGISMDGTNTNEVRAVIVNSRIVNNNTSLNLTSRAYAYLDKTSIASRLGNIVNNGTVYTYGDNAIVDGVTGNPLTTTPLK